MNSAEEYTSILNHLESMRENIIKQNEFSISFLGKLPEQDAAEIENILKIEGTVLSVLTAKGSAVCETMPDKPQFLRFSIGEKVFLNHKHFISDVKLESAKAVKKATEQVEPKEAKESKPEQAKLKKVSEEELLNNEEHQFTKKSLEKGDNRVKLSELVFERMTIGIRHPEAKKQDVFTITAAPLRLYKYSTPNVPILISVETENGQRFTQSSYDSYVPGKNLVQMSIEDYSLLFRGSFDDNGQYHTIIATTEKSASMGDKLELLDQKAFGTGPNNSVYGHPQVPYLSDEGDAIVCVIPLVDEKTEKYIAVSKTEEFTTYSEIVPEEGKETKIYTPDGEKKVIPQIVGEYLELNII